MAANRPARTAKDQRQEEVRARIVEAARELFETKGAEGLSIRAIATRAGLPTMTLYSYFPNKMAIVRALWSLAFDPLFAAMTAAEEAETDPKARLRAVAHAYVDYWLAHPDRYRIIYTIEDRRESGQDQWFIEETDVIASHMRFGPLIAAARGAPDKDHREEAEALICALTGVAHLLIGVSEYPWRSGVTYVDAILRGFVSPSAT